MKFMNSPKPGFHPIYIIAAVLHLSIFVCVGIAFFLADTLQWVFSAQLRPEFTFLTGIFVFISLGNALLSLKAPRIFKKLVFQNANDPMQEQPLLTITIIRMALAESIVLLGFALSFLQQNHFWILPFAAFSLLLQCLVGPFTTFLRSKPII